ncbi:hypothetical protein RUMLAC_01629 [[Ruminococcus] lactaris ATCC 29176]|uniref:Uncharacterized protein n=1 Tax=[Ruminococcus] lactaris ATCC 29176 TaxID=471875 RepID=B5CQ84_9FIRM|nr:hypothetical protein RUMLAC_01629 [[Ruminococcus] lactaris ATCC 29176]
MLWYTEHLPPAVSSAYFGIKSRYRPVTLPTPFLHLPVVRNHFVSFLYR